MKPITTYRALIAACGLSQREAADFLDIPEATSKNYAQAKSRAPDGILAELAALEAQITETVANALEAADAMIKRAGSDPLDIELAFCDDTEARSRGWPNAAAHTTALGRIAAALIEAGHRPRLVPAATTATTAVSEALILQD